ncbi:MAG: anthranilate phosphoribosyltransferase [Verrucomicrobiota bacterium]
MSLDLALEQIQQPSAQYDLGLVSSLIDDLLDPEIEAEKKENFLKLQTEKGESSEELAAFAKAILPKAVELKVKGSWQGKSLLDCCGTGGGGLDMVNISTGSMFLIAAAGVPVAKHGNKGVTKKSGSSNVLEALGIKIQATPDDLEIALERTGMTFIFAPAFHPAFKHLAPIRQSLAAKGHRTIFNLLGPLLNPVEPEAQIIGVFKEQYLELFYQALSITQCARYLVLHGVSHEGSSLGELSAYGSNCLSGKLAGEHSSMRFDTARTQGSLNSLLISSAEESAKRIVAVLERRENGLLREMLILNAAAGLWAQGNAESLEEGIEQATESLENGEAFNRLKKWQSI